MSIALETFMIALSPFAGSFTATFVHNSLDGGRAFTLQRQCGVCGHCVTGANLIALYSWTANSGTCPYCRARTPLLYPATELGFLAVAVLASLLVPGLWALPAILLGWALIALAAFDVLGFVLPDFLTYGIAASGIGLAASGGGVTAFESAAGVLSGGASLLLVKSAYRLIANREGLGLGDVKLFAAAGAWVGSHGLPQVLLIASLLGLGFAATHFSEPEKSVLMKKIPFGAALCAALWGTWIWELLSAQSLVILAA